MFRLTREVRLALNPVPDSQLQHPTANGFGGYPAVVGWAPFCLVRCTMGDVLDRQSQYLINIKDIDAAVRRQIPALQRMVQQNVPLPIALRQLFDALKNGWPEPARLRVLSLALSPFSEWSMSDAELPMICLTHKFEFAASHRLHNPALSESENRQLFGKCNNPLGHGHNYEVAVRLRGEVDEHGMLLSVSEMERIVDAQAIRRLDHKYLNVEVPEFTDLIPSVENIARVIYSWLKPQLNQARVQLASVTVWETSKTWCEYSE